MQISSTTISPAATTGEHTETRSRRISPLVVTGIAGAGELLVLALSGFATAALWIGAADAFDGSRYALAILATAVAAVITAERMQLYTTACLAAPLGHLWRISTAWMLALALLVSSVFLLKTGPEFSRGWLMLWLASGFAAMVAYRMVTARVVAGLRAAGRLNRRAVVYGAGEAGASLVDRLTADANSDVAICGIFDDRGLDRVPDSLAGYPMLGNIDQLVAFCRCNEIDLLILSLPITAERRLLEIMKKLWVLPVDIRLAAHAHGLSFRPRAYSHVGSVPCLDLSDRPLGDGDRLVKAVFDRVVAAAALIVLSPVMALVALAVKLDSPGPVFFRQKRHGFNNELVDVWKFRSMRTDMADHSASRLVTKGDARVTKVGRIIRKTSLDELPQLFNVLGGTLSLVGPRPHAAQAKAADRLYHEVVDGYFARHKVKPGITGLAQIRGWRGETDTEEKIQGRVAADLEYIETWSLALDLYVLVKTPIALLKSDNAY